jgi:hypothetical protein
MTHTPHFHPVIGGQPNRELQQTGYKQHLKKKLQLLKLQSKIKTGIDCYE